MAHIEFPKTHTLVSERDLIEFPAIVDGETITCRITLEEMQRQFARGNPETFEDEFLHLRPHIEEEATATIQQRTSSDRAIAS